MCAKLNFVRVKPGQKDIAERTFKDRVLPLIAKERGYRGGSLLVDEDHSDRLIAITFWDKEEDMKSFYDEANPRYRETMDVTLPAIADRPEGCDCRVATRRDSPRDSP